MFKVKALFIAGIALLLEGYFQIVRDVMPVDFFNQTSGEDVYYKVVIAQDGFNGDIVFYTLGVLLLVLAVLLLRKSKRGAHDI
ncbi:hypothetical protein [Aliiglaciecola litoralis]|uniref:Uncharacterized protein n=1 Tax=Aliiglaciecola litoralis TaxID=582857 RepID=A0ABN1LQE2_9ALTE